MAEGSASLSREFWSELAAQASLKGLSKLGFKLLELFASSHSDEVKEQARRYVFGNKETDEQIFKLAMAHAVNENYITTHQRDLYLTALAELSRKKQNDYRLYVIQTWNEKAKDSEVIDRAARVIQHDAKLVESNRRAWDAQIQIFDLDLPPIPDVFNDICASTRKLEAKNAKLETYNNWATRAMWVTGIVGLIAVVIFAAIFIF